MKKVLSFVLVLALVLSSFSMAFASQSTEIKTLSDIEGNANAEAIQVNYDLGIVTGNPDGTFQPEKAVTRAGNAMPGKTIKSIYSAIDWNATLSSINVI